MGKNSTTENTHGSRYVRTCGAARGSVVLVPSVTLAGTLVRVALLCPSARGYGVMYGILDGSPLNTGTSHFSCSFCSVPSDA